MHEISRLSALIRKESSRALEKVGLKPVDFVVLKTLSAQAATPKRLAVQLGLTKAAVTYIADKLESRGLVRRVRKAEDRRHVVLVLTKRGARILARAEQVYTRTLQKKLAALSQQQLENLEQTLEKLTQLFRQE